MSRKIYKGVWARFWNDGRLCAARDARKGSTYVHRCDSQTWCDIIGYIEHRALSIGCTDMNVEVSIDEVARETGCGTSAVAVAIRWLEERGLLEWHRRGWFIVGSQFDRESAMLEWFWLIEAPRSEIEHPQEVCDA